MTQSIRLRWLPELRFYEERVPILRRLQESGLLQAFRVSEETIDAELPNWCWLSVAQSGLTLNLLDATDDTSDAWEIVKSIVDKIGPLSYTHARVSYQHIVELPFESFEAAVASGHASLFQSLGTTEAILGDWALLSDVVVIGPPAGGGHIEFGIVRDNEIDFRLKRVGGRGPGMQHLGQREWEQSAFKQVSLFADSNLTSPVVPGHEKAFLEDAGEFWRASRNQMSRLVSELSSKLIDNHNGGTS